MKFYLIKHKENKTTSSCMPYLFKTKESAQRYIEEMTYFPDEFTVVKAIEMED